MASRRGVGSIRKLPSGKYQVRFTDPFGIRRTARTTFQTKSLAEFELTRIRGAIENGTWHMDVNALDLEGTSNPVDLEIAAAGTVKRVIRPNAYERLNSTGSLQHILDLMEVKTVWHPKGH